MSPYHPAQRQSASEGTRARIVAAAREVLADPDAPVDFTVDAVARRAGVSRMTVYYQFGGRAALLEAVLDDLAVRGGMPEIAAAMQQASAAAALDQVVAVFCGFWASQRLVVRRLRAMAVLDPELSGVFRDERRRLLIRAALSRDGGGSPARPPAAESVIDLLVVLTGFETYDALAAESTDAARVTDLLQRACTVLVNADLGPPGGSSAEAS